MSSEKSEIPANHTSFLANAARVTQQNQHNNDHGTIGLERTSKAIVRNTPPAGPDSRQSCAFPRASWGTTRAVVLSEHRRAQGKRPSTLRRLHPPNRTAQPPIPSIQKSRPPSSNTSQNPSTWVTRHKRFHLVPIAAIFWRYSSRCEVCGLAVAACSPLLACPTLAAAKRLASII
jgi:hypothetical protein